MDLAARASIDTPERQAYRDRLVEEKKFAKTVSSAMGLLNAHNNLKPIDYTPKQNF